jgi:exosortase/archaeosortase family protein
MMHPLALAALMLAATWHSAAWLLNRLYASPDEGLTLFATVALLAGLALPRLRGSGLAPTIPVTTVAILLALHGALTMADAPLLFRASLAVTGLLWIAYRAAFESRPPPAFWVLVSLSMPVLPSLQFVLGYPMRLVSAVLTVALLDLQGVPAGRDGTYVTIGGETVQFDAPCSGVAMLWTLTLVTLVVALFDRFGPVRLCAALALTAAIAVVCNVLRVSSLLFADAALTGAGISWVHEAIGLAAFAISASGLVLLLRAPFFVGQHGGRA